MIYIQCVILPNVESYRYLINLQDNLVELKSMFIFVK